MELAILDWIQTHLRCEFLDAVLPAISWTCNHGELWIVLAVAAFVNVVLFLRAVWRGKKRYEELSPQAGPKEGACN